MGAVGWFAGIASGAADLFAWRCGGRCGGREHQQGVLGNRPVVPGQCIEEGRALRPKITLEATLADTQAAIDYAKQFGKVAVVGYCWGGSIAFFSTTRLSGVTAAVGYYGGMIAAHANEKPRVPLILHFGDKDQSIPMTDVEKIKQAQPGLPIYVYGAGHGFSCDERPSFDKTAHELALGRTTAFLKQHIG